MIAPTIRKGLLKDVPAAYDLVIELAVYEKEPESVTATLADYEADFQAGIYDLLVAEVDQRVVGMCLYFMMYSTWKGKMLYLDDFVVSADFRRQGIGELLFDAFLQEAHNRGAKMVKWQVLDWNKPALNFYSKYQATIETHWWNGKIIF